MKVIKSFFAGLGIGFAVAAGIYILAQVLDLIGCFFTCGSMACFSQSSCVGQMGLYNSSVATKIFAVCTIAGTVIGSLYGIAKHIQEGKEEKEKKVKELSEEYKKQTEKYAADFKQKVNLAVSQCEENRNNAKNFELQPVYECTSLQGELWKKLHEISIPLQELVDIVEEFSAVKEEK